MIDDSMQEIVNDFIQEALELLDSLNENFIELEKNPEDKEILNTIFRAAHTVKGSAGFLGFQNIVELAHSAENILNKLRQGEITLTSEMTDYLLKTMDVLRSMIVTVSETGSEGEPPEGNTGLIKKLNELSEGIGGGSEKKTSAEVSNSNTAIAAPETQDKEVPNAAVADADKEKTKTVDSADKMPDSGKKKPRSLGDILLEDNLISKEELEEIYKEKEEEEHTAEKVTAVPEVSAEEIPHPSASAKAFQSAEEKQVSGKPAEEIKSNPVPQKPVSAAAAKPAFAVPTASPAAEIKETTIRVDIERLDNVMNLVGELVLARNRLFNISSKLEIKYADDDISSTLAQVVAGLNLVTTDLQLAVMKTRMQPVKKVFSKFPRMVRDLSRELGKDIELLISGEETELDKSVIEEIGDPLVHLIRNSVDHGVEDKETRKLNGKPERGTIRLGAEHEGNYIIISVLDDGKGMDPAIIKRKAVEKGVIDEKTAASLSDKDALNLIFAPGFSTKDKATEISGRGVGMDVVKTNIQKLNGIIEINSVPGQGSTIILKLPLTVAIIQTLIVGIGDEVFAIPLNSVVETLRIKESTIQTIDKHEVINLRKSVLSLLRLGEEFGVSESAVSSVNAKSSDREIYVVVVALAEKKIGIVVDDLFGQEEVVIKSLGDYQLGYKGISGATITGDGKVVLIIDVASMIDAVSLR
ncbi:MAG: chemotaxis protein CheA [Candidatus Acidulodesulfobacterium acidiphilum]|uniref:histidine kinase n=1 Tax=Candidatus Acidulodesulfobacterium acidiphilum TaxID=2597224 RepID=A0A520X9X8_9DELT|nr:MAG: chemotaxis protein CheA [Candidatus Acidulodesulfobacterium acidiphilum]